MKANAADMVAAQAAKRVDQLDYAHDWLANMTSWTDDARVFYERSVGSILNGQDLTPKSTHAAGPSTALRPSALYLSTNLLPATTTQSQVDRGGWLETDYGKGGNLLALTVHGQCSHTNASTSSCVAPPGGDIASRRSALRANCTCAREQHYVYRWDELNRLHEARRYDRNNGGSWTLAARQRVRYDGANQRVVKQVFDPSTGQHRAALYVYPGDFERRGLVPNAAGTAWIPGPNNRTETQYLVAGARVVWQNGTHAATALDAQQRITFSVKNLIQSTSAVIDLISGELVEVGGFYPNGAREESLGASDAVGGAGVPLEPVGFTGKEADEEVGLTYFGERYLVQRIGRWATPDPLSVHAMGGGEAGNAYHYVSGNLLQARDPLGLRGWDFDTYKQWELTYTREGNHLQVYVPPLESDTKHENSGMTVGVGADGKNGVEFLNKVDGVSPELRELMQKGVGKKGQAAQDEIDAWAKSHDGKIPGLTAPQSDQLMQEYMAPKYLRIARERSTGMTTTKAGKEVEYKGKWKAETTVSTERFDSLDPIVKEVLVDIAWNTAYYAFGKENDITDAIREGDTVQVLKNLQKFNNEKLQGTWGAPIRDKWLSERIADLEGTPPAGSAPNAPTTVVTDTSTGATATTEAK